MGTLPLQRGQNSRNQSHPESAAGTEFSGLENPSADLQNRLAMFLRWREWQRRNGKWIPELPYAQKWFRERRYLDDNTGATTATESGMRAATTSRGTPLSAIEKIDAQRESMQ